MFVLLKQLLERNFFLWHIRRIDIFLGGVLNQAKINLDDIQKILLAEI